MWLDNGFFHPIQFCHTFWLYTAQKMKFSIKCFFSKCNQISRKLQIWSHLLKKSSMENFIFLAVLTLHLLAMLILIFFSFMIIWAVKACGYRVIKYFFDEIYFGRESNISKEWSFSWNNYSQLKLLMAKRKTTSTKWMSWYQSTNARL